MAVRDSLSAPGLKRSPWTRFKAGVRRRLGWLWRPLLYAGILLGFLFGRALPGSQIAPLGVAFYAAVRGAGFGGAGALAVAVAVMGGGVVALPLTEGLWVALAIVTCHVGSTLLRIGRKAPSPLGATIMASMAAAVPAGILYGAKPVVELAFWLLLTGVLTLLFTLGITDITSGRAFQVGSADSPVPPITILAGALLGLQGIAPVAGVSLHHVAAGVLVTVCAYLGGPSLGAAAGAVVGIPYLVTSLGQAGAPHDTQGMAYVLAGLLAGTFRVLHKLGVGMAFSLGFITFAMVTVGDSRELESLCYGAAAATLMFWLIPRSWLAGVPLVLVSQGENLRETPERGQPETLPVLDRVCSMSRVLKELGRTFEQAAAVEAPRDEGFGRALEQATQRVCHSCALYQQCWEKELPNTYQVFTDLWAQLDEEGSLPIQPVPENLKIHCIRPAEVATTLNYLYDLNRSHTHWERRLEEGRAVVGDYVKQVARMLDRFVDEVGTSEGRERLEQTPGLKVVSGAARLPKRGGHISGDSYVGAPLGADRYLLALSDGMGVGRGAAIQSKQCVSLLQEVLGAGFAADLAVRMVNSFLLLRSPDETFATVDLSLFDLSTGRAEYVKVGAAPTFIKRGSDITMVKSATVPVGIINQVQVEPEFRVMRPGDLVVMITDGVWDVSKDGVDKERWILQHLSREASSDPEEIAESVLARALELMPAPEDDMTVLVARVDPVSGSKAAAEARRPSVGTWAPVRLAPRMKAEPPSRPGQD